MEGKDGLFRGSAGRGDEIHSLRFQCGGDGAADSNNCFRELNCGMRVSPPKIGHVFRRNHKRVARSCGIEREEREPGFAFIDEFDRSILSSSDRADLAVLFFDAGRQRVYLPFTTKIATTSTAMIAP